MVIPSMSVPLKEFSRQDLLSKVQRACLGNSELVFHLNHQQSSLGRHLMRMLSLFRK